MKVSRESFVIICICLLDLVATIWLVATRRAIEGNPVMSFYLDQGWFALIAAKTLLIVFPIFIAEWGRRYRPTFVRRALRLAIVVYLGVYLTAFINLDVMASVRSISSADRPTAAQNEQAVDRAHQ